MRVTFQSAFKNGLYNANKAAVQVQRRSLEVGSGLKVNKASDDPTAMAAIINEKTQMSNIDSYIKAADSVDSRLSVVDSVLSDVINQISVAQTNGVAGRTTVLNATQRDALARAIEGSRDTILSAINTKFSDAYLFSGGQSLTAPYTDGTTYYGDANVASLTISDGRTVQTTFDGGAIIGDLFNTLTTLATAVRAGDLATVDTSLATLDAGFDRVQVAQTHVGVDLSRLVEDSARLDSLRLASDKRRAANEETNMAESISGMKQAEAAQDAALSMLSVASRLKLLDYLK
jgi:flagellar hook-associated protein 3 FlgL